MAERLTPEREQDIREQAPGLAAAFTDWLNRYSPLYGDQQMADTVETLLHDVPALVAEVDRVRANAADELLPAWEAVYEPGNVSDYLIGYTNDECAAKAAAKAWLKSQRLDGLGRVEWVPEAALYADSAYDQWFELIEHKDGATVGHGLIVRRRMAASSVTAEDEQPVKPSRFSAAPAQVDDYLRRGFTEEVVLNYQRAIGNRAVEEAARDIRMEAAAMELHKPMSAIVARSMSDHIDPLQGGGHYPSVLLCGKHTGFGPCPGAPRCTPPAEAGEL